MKDKQISKFLSLVLRHQPEILHIELDDEGWTDIDVLIKHVEYYEKSKIDWNDIERVVAENDKQRFSISGTKIRANQGHSVKLNIKFEEKEPPDILYHGTTDKAKNLILKENAILPMKRHHVHLSADFETALSVAKRRTSQLVIFRILAKNMYKDGYKYYISENGIWLTEKVPVDYFYEIHFV